MIPFVISPPEYNQLLLQSFCTQTIPNVYIIFKLTKCCGYSEVVILPKYSNMVDMNTLLVHQFGNIMHNKTYYYNPVLPDEKIYLHTLPDTLRISQFIRRLSWAYEINESSHSVFQLYYDSDCIECS